MRYEAVLFDLDGTLLDTLEDLADAVNRALQGKGFPAHPVETYRYFVGEGASLLIRRALPEAARTEEMVRACLDAFGEEYGCNWRAKTRPYPGVPEMLDALVERGLTLAVLSNKPHAFTVQCVASLLPDWSFDVILGLRDEAGRKPDPSGALEVARRVDIAPAAFLYLGDSGTDMKTAVAAGMYPVGALWGFRTADELREGGAEALIARPHELLRLLD